MNYNVNHVTKIVFTGPGGLPGSAMLVVDSLPFGHDYDQTLLPCSPGSMMATDVAAKTVLEVHVHENAMEAAAEQDDKVGYMNQIWTHTIYKSFNFLKVNIYIYINIYKAYLGMSELW